MEKPFEDAYRPIWTKIIQKSIQIIKLDKLLFKLHFSFLKWQVS